MKESDFLAKREQAIALHQAQPKGKGEPAISLDAIFTALHYSGDVAEDDPGKKRLRRIRDDDAEQWFIDTLAKIKKGGGETLTVSRFLMIAGRWPATRTDQLNVGRWLREAGHQPRKSGGQSLYDL